MDGRKGQQSHDRISLQAPRHDTVHMYLHVSIVYCVEKNVRVRVQGKGGMVIKLQISCSRPFTERPNPEAKFLNL